MKLDWAISCLFCFLSFCSYFRGRSSQITPQSTWLMDKVIETINVFDSSNIVAVVTKIDHFNTRLLLSHITKALRSNRGTEVPISCETNYTEVFSRCFFAVFSRRILVENEKMCPTLTVGSFFRHERSTFLFSSFVQQLGGGSKHSKSQNLVQNKKKETNGRPGKHNKGPKFDISNFFRHYETFFRIFLLQQRLPLQFFTFPPLPIF